MMKPRMHPYFIGIALFIAAAFLISLCVGQYPIGLREVFKILSGSEISDITRGVFFTLRLPRTVTALLVGAALGMAGGVFQYLFRNPLASPDIIGASSGANLGAALAITVFGYNAALTTLSAFVFGLIAMILVVILVKFGGNGSAVTYILFGIIVKALSEAFIMTLKFFADPERELAAMEYWSMGSLASITLSKLVFTLPFFAIGFLGLIVMRRHTALLGLKDDESRALGVRVGLVRTIVIALATLIAAAAVSLVGMVVFVGLNAPHAARLMLKRSGFSQFVLSAMIGALILLVSDCVARSISGIEIPVSIPTTLIGVPILVVFLLKRKAGEVQ